MSNLPVELYVEGKIPSTCGAGASCSFYYNDYRTPHLRSIYPASTNPSGLINLWGYFLSYSTAEFKRIKVGGFLCERFTIFEGMHNLNDDETLSYWSYHNVECRMAPDIPAGIYNLDLLLKLGTPIN